jgi:hypothetical protein
MKKHVPKPYNAGTMTVSAFWAFIRSALRQKSRWWKPILETKRAARKPYKGPNKRQKWEYQCSSCKLWFQERNVNVDHKKPVGQLRDYSDLPEFVKTLFCEKDNLQVLCSTCHDKKTEKEKKSREKKRRKAKK